MKTPQEIATAILGKEPTLPEERATWQSIVEGVEADRAQRDFASAHSDLYGSLRLGVEVESQDPALEAATSLTEDQIGWAAAWLAGEGFSRL